MLVVSTAPIDPDTLQPHLSDGGQAADETLVVAPAASQTRLDWLTNDEDDARREARDRAKGLASAVEGSVETRVGDGDPLVAIGDALRTFDATEIVLVTRSGDDSGWLESHAAQVPAQVRGIPVRRLVV